MGGGNKPSHSRFYPQPPEIARQTISPGQPTFPVEIENNWYLPEGCRGSSHHWRTRTGEAEHSSPWESGWWDRRGCFSHENVAMLPASSAEQLGIESGGSDG